jgi:hypothetical protein
MPRLPLVAAIALAIGASIALVVILRAPSGTPPNARRPSLDRLQPGPAAVRPDQAAQQGQDGAQPDQGAQVQVLAAPQQGEDAEAAQARVRAEAAAAQAAAMARGREEERRAQAVREESLRQQVSTLRSQVAELSNALDASRGRISELEQALASLQQERRAVTEDPRRRAAELDSAVATMSSAELSLIGGSGDVSGALAQARSLLAEVNARAAAMGSGDEAGLAASAARDLDLAADALQRRAFFEARVAIDRASREAQQALAIVGNVSGVSPRPATAPSPSVMSRY